MQNKYRATASVHGREIRGTVLIESCSRRNNHSWEFESSLIQLDDTQADITMKGDYIYGWRKCFLSLASNGIVLHDIAPLKPEAPAKAPHHKDTE